MFRLRCVKFRSDNLSGDVDALSITTVTLLNLWQKEERKKKKAEVKKLIAWPLSTLWRRHRPACTLPRYIRIINVDRSGSPYSLPWCGRMCQVGEWQLSRKVTQGKFISQRVNGTAKGGKKQQDKENPLQFTNRARMSIRSSIDCLYLAINAFVQHIDFVFSSIFGSVTWRSDHLKWTCCGAELCLRSRPE